ncbi:homologous-pairing protein 2 homolog [Ixodes scapularis]|uniref:homologous-pairing protein 2 homolog n=1 Tax=Ixodes scapularis TaxID=6945 RepID=UPI001A9ECC25|nr:homologous-pairing protein 2 homolog [Ixodes scapularis]
MSKTKEVAAEKAILDYVKAQNRPYSSNDIFNNLHKEHGKAAVVRALEQLAQDNKIKEKTYGKQKIYFADQDEFPDVAEAELAAMDQETNALGERLQEASRQLQARESLLSSLSNSLTTEQVAEKIKQMTEERDKLVARLEKLTSNTSFVEPKVRDKIYKDKETAVKEWRRRKRMANDMLDAILEGYPKGKKALLEEAGVETDEDAKVVMPK